MNEEELHQALGNLDMLAGYLNGSDQTGLKINGVPTVTVEQGALTDIAEKIRKNLKDIRHALFNEESQDVKENIEF